ncbi:hypothetical protein ED733_007484 [Metarhizium rileyi]|uniref:Extracellular serine-rich protein n=1 Tax=Metarhizium rileyi (strain RCEF 4871) TaxID=1649241 RepID=A0A5C6GPB9_METRR|nr:hypothetical protein ED733_007484 [Metarhizium rileyi]
MHFTSLALATLLSSAQANVNVHRVAVGMNPDKNETALKFFPEKITAQPGEMVQFQFWTGNHTVTQSSFDDPCAPVSRTNSSAPGIFSSFQPTAASASMGMIPVFTVMINDTKPIWVYCSQGPHCQKGMSMVINENTSANSSRSLENYRKLSESTQQGNGGVPAGAGVATNNGGSGASPGSGNSTSSVVGTDPATEPPPANAGMNLAVPSTLLLVVGAVFTLL